MRALIATLLASALFTPSVASGQANDGQAEAGWSVRATFANDLFAGTDQYYTNGVRLDVVTPPNDLTWLGREARDLTRGLFGQTGLGTWHATFSLGQDMYTPQDLTRRFPDPEDRPYAGYLFASLGLIAEGTDQLQTLALDLGVVGRMAQADDAQRVVHDVIAGEDPLGWSFQLRNEPGVRLIYEWRGRYGYELDLGLMGLQADFAPGFAVSLGNVDTSASIGGTMRISQGTASRFGPPRLRPRVAAPPMSETDGFDWYAFFGVEGRVVGRNIFLEGNTFRNSANVEPHRLVGDLQGGFAIRRGDFELTYTHVLRSPEFQGQRGMSQFGLLSFSWQY